MIKGLAHLCFVVRDLETSLAFYRDMLGLTPAFDFINDKGHRYGVYLHLDGRHFIELFEGTVGPQPEKPTYHHFCLEVDDINAAVADLRAKGVKATDPEFGRDNSWQCWLNDPDGNRIEMHCYTPTSWQAPWLK